MKNYSLFEQFRQSLKIAFPCMEPGEIRKKLEREWATAKQKFPPKTDDFQNYIKQKMIENAKKGRTKKCDITTYFDRRITQEDGLDNSSLFKSKPNSIQMIDASNQPSTSSAVPNKEIIQKKSEKNADLLSDSKIKNNHREKPAQEKLRLQIEALEENLKSKKKMKNLHFESLISSKEIKKDQMELDMLKKKLNRLQKRAPYMKGYRQKRKEAPDQISRPGPGAPRLEEKYPNLMQDILDIASFGGGAEERRRTEEIRCCHSLKSLHEKLVAKGYNISLNATYLRLLPKKSNSTEGKRHKTTVPVKLARAQNNAHKKHPDSEFCTATIRALESLASLLGQNQVAFLSQDDKARVPIGLAAVQKQSSILMHVEYRVKLPDHDWVVANRHKLIPSVTAGIIIEKKERGSPGCVSYSGPTYIAIRSGKHDSSTAESHAVDFKRIVELEEFREIIKIGQKVKSIVIITVDGGPDENPRYRKVINENIKHFKEYDLDGIFIACNAPGRSAFNRVERRMAPLSKQLSGLILSAETYGKHLDKQGRTIDEELEVKNFAGAGTLLANIWSEMVLDGYPVVAEYKDPRSKDYQNEEVILDHIWYMNHVRESQYFLQIVKCKNRACCSETRSNLHDVLESTNFFMPPPLKIFNDEKSGILNIAPPKESRVANKKKEKITEENQKLIKNNEDDESFVPFGTRLCLRHLRPKDYNSFPYDYFCPSIYSRVSNRICPTCGQYFASTKMLDAHQKALNHKKGKKLEKSKKNILSVEACRDNEILCIFYADDKESRDCEWIDRDILENLDSSSYDNNINTGGLIRDSILIASDIEDLGQWPFENPWEPIQNSINEDF